MSVVKSVPQCNSVNIVTEMEGVAVGLTRGVAVHTEAVPPGVADGLQGLRLAAAVVADLQTDEGRERERLRRRSRRRQQHTHRAVLTAQEAVCWG